MKNMASGLIGAIIGAIIGAAISGVIAYKIFQKQMLINQYAAFAEDIEKAVRSHNMWKSIEVDDFHKAELKNEIELALNRAWSRALVTLPDEVVLEIDKMISREQMDAKIRNRVYYLLRKQLYPETSIQYDDIMTRNISIKE